MLDNRWNEGMYLGTSGVSGEHYLGISKGYVVHDRGVARVKPEHRWNPARAGAIVGTPMKPNADNDESIDAYAQPHANLDDAARDQLAHEEDLHPHVQPPPATPDVVR